MTDNKNPEKGKKEDSPLQDIDRVIGEDLSRALGVVSSPSTTIEIAVDITEKNKTSRALGQMVYTVVKEDDLDIIAIGQIISVETKNRWHEDQSFKGVIKRYGALPNLSGVADNRLARISVQSSFKKEENLEPHILGISPSTGEGICKMTDDMMSVLVSHHRGAITYIGRVFGTDVHMPMWFKHFGDTDETAGEFGVGEAYHIGVFGKSGSGKSVASSLTLLGYAKNKKKMNILILDPQGQFTRDNKLLPSGKKFGEEIARITGRQCEKYNLARDVYLVEDRDLFGDLLVENGFIEKAFNLHTSEKQDLMRDCVLRYLEGKARNGIFNLEAVTDPKGLLRRMLGRFLENKEYVNSVYSQSPYQNRLREQIERLKTGLDDEFYRWHFEGWFAALRLFSARKDGGGEKISMGDLIDKVAGEQGGHFVILDLRPGDVGWRGDNLQALFLRIVEKGIIEKGASLYAEDKQTNCLIVMDEAHRYVARNSPDPRVRKLAPDLIDAVRTTRKYGIGHMFITQTLESMDDEIIKQMRIFAFGHGLTTGSELRKVSEIAGNKSAVDLYKSFVDPASNRRYPFMFRGPVSPLSATGSPLFVEMYTDFADFEKKNTFSDE